jgi:hypothetical protein
MKTPPFAALRVVVTPIITSSRAFPQFAHDHQSKNANSYLGQAAFLEISEPYVLLSVALFT